MEYISWFWLIMFSIWGLPLGIYRSKFRKIVYNTTDWKINIKPWFWQETKALFGFYTPESQNFVKFRNFYRFYLLIYFLLLISYQIFNIKETTMSKIEVGSKIPSFTLKNQYNTDFTIDSLVGKKNLVIYFYPKDETPGCTTEACNFRDQYKIFKEIDAEVVGISTDSPDSHLKFAKKHQLPFILLSDPEDKIRKLFGVPNDLLDLLKGRVTYVINKQGTVIHTFNSQFKAAQHIQEAINALYKI